MNRFVRQLAALSVLWSLCELLVPQGRQQPALRMTMRLLMMTVLLSNAGQLLGQPVSWPAWTERTAEAAQQSYHHTYLKAVANQLENYCVGQAQRVGYRADAAVWLRMDGSVEKISLKLSQNGLVLMSGQEVVQYLAAELGLESGIVQLEEP